MVCPTCDHTMQSISSGIFWCPRCGMLKTNSDEYIPTLVDRCRRFETHSFKPQTAEEIIPQWHRLGIAASINVPADRPGKPARGELA